MRRAILLTEIETRTNKGVDIMTDKPEYIELLNAISLQEARAGVWIKAWSEKTTHPGLKGCLDLVAARETSHGKIFERRVRELGGSPTDVEDPEYNETLRVFASDMPDPEKIAWLNEYVTRLPKPTVEERYKVAVDDAAVDPLTRSLLRWFMDVEKDSGDSMKRVYEQMGIKD